MMMSYHRQNLYPHVVYMQIGEVTLIITEIKQKLKTNLYYKGEVHSVLRAHGRRI